MDIFATAIIIVKIYVFFCNANIFANIWAKKITKKIEEIFATANIIVNF